MPLAVLVPEVVGQGAGAGIEDVGILQHLVVEIVLGQQVERAGLDAHVDVLRHQDDRALWKFLLQVDDDRQDLVVHLGGRQPGGSSPLIASVCRKSRPLASLLDGP